jgi:3-hydroxybutyryl-CoA dehydrogenase
VAPAGGPLQAVPFVRLDERVGHVEVIAVLGAEEEGCRLALRAALASCAVRLYDPDPAVLRRAQERIRASIEQGVAAGRLRPEDKQRALDGILATADLEEAVTHGDLIVEAGERTGAERRALFLRVGESCRATALIATCRGSPDELMDWIPQPGRLLCLRMSGSLPSVEPGVETSVEALERARQFTERLGGEPTVT